MLHLRRLMLLRYGVTAASAGIPDLGCHGYDDDTQQAKERHTHPCRHGYHNNSHALQSRQRLCLLLQQYVIFAVVVMVRTRLFLLNKINKKNNLWKCCCKLFRLKLERLWFDTSINDIVNDPTDRLVFDWVPSECDWIRPSSFYKQDGILQSVFITVCGVWPCRIKRGFDVTYITEQRVMLINILQWWSSTTLFSHTFIHSSSTPASLLCSFYLDWMKKSLCEPPLMFPERMRAGEEMTDTLRLYGH